MGKLLLIVSLPLERTDLQAVDPLQPGSSAGAAKGKPHKFHNSHAWSVDGPGDNLDQFRLRRCR